MITPLQDAFFALLTFCVGEDAGKGKSGGFRRFSRYRRRPPFCGFSYTKLHDLIVDSYDVQLEDIGRFVGSALLGLDLAGCLWMVVRGRILI